MKLNKLANAILRGSFLMEARTAAGFMPIAARFLSGQKISWFDDEDDEEEKEKFLKVHVITTEGSVTKISAQGEQAGNVFQNVPAGSVFVLPINGAIMMDDYCGSPGTATMASWLKDARDSENVIAGILHINSGGGTVEGTAEFAQVVAEVAQDMPLEVYTDGMIASAAYWIASPLNITASSGTVEIGSIGTAIKFNDFSKMYAEMGVTSHYINADESFDKNQDYYKALQGNYTPIKQNILNPTNALFKAAVKENRGDKLQITAVKDEETGQAGEEPMTGNTYLAQTAIELGLIDAIGTMDVVFNSVSARAVSDQFIAKNQNKNMSLKKLMEGFGASKFPALAALASKKAADITDADILAVNEELEAAGIENVVIISSADMQEAITNSAAIDKGLTAITAALAAEKPLTSLDAAITALIADRDAEFDRAEEYGDQPGAVASKVKTKADQEGGGALAKTTADMNELEKKAYKRQQIQDKKEKMNFNLED